MGLAVVHQPQVAVAVLGEQRLGLGDVDEPAQRVGDLAAAVIRGMGLQATRVTLEQEVGRPRRRDALVRVGLGQPVDLAVDHEAGAALEDVLVHPQQAHVLAEHRPRAARHRDHQRAGAVARLERPHAEQRELPLAVARHRPAGAEQRPVEIDVQAAHAGIVPGFSVMMNVRLPSSLP